MKRGPIGRFIVRWFVCSLGFWIASGFLSTRTNPAQALQVDIVAGFLLALLNSVIKPVIVILSLPAILFSLGLFMLVINGLMVWLVSYIYEPLRISSFGTAMLAGIIIGLVNYLVSTILEE